MISATAESPTVLKSIAIATEEVKFVEANAIAQTATIAQASQICKKIRTPNQKRRQK